MRTFTAVRRRRLAPALVVVLGIAAVALPATAQEAQLEVDCGEETFLDDDEDLVYLLIAGEERECTVTGLDPDSEDPATWGYVFFDMEAEDDDLVAEDDELPLAVDDDGTATFVIPVPEEPPALWMFAWVAQGDAEVVIYGSTVWQGIIECEPDPVTEGETVTCTAEELLEDEEFGWWVVLFDDEYDEIDELTGEGTADGDGLGVFTFEVPAGEGIVAYAAVAEQELYVAWFDGEVDAAEVEPPPPTPTPSPTPTTPSTPAPPTATPTARPVTQPTRVETGAGGTAPMDGSSLLVGALTLGGLALLARRAVLR
jgi:hypothetical protein